MSPGHGNPLRPLPEHAPVRFMRPRPHPRIHRWPRSLAPAPVTALPAASQGAGGRWLIAGGALLIAVGVVAGGALWRRRGGSPEAEPEQRPEATAPDTGLD